MQLPTLTEGRLLRRRNRFVAEVELPSGVVEAHCPNTGSMLGCREPGSRVWLSAAENPARKLAWTWELVESAGTLVGIHTGRSNGLVREAIEAGTVPELTGYKRIRGEVRYGVNSRIDLLLEADGRPPCYVEVKNVTAAVDAGIGYFPDAVTERGAKHLREMMAVVASGGRAVLCFCVQRADVWEVRPADHIDPVYGRTLREALAAGVEAYALGARLTPASIFLEKRLPVVA
ncbi:Sugar fermentation stimulation protein A [Rhodocyclaceae bacterium]|nr:Sugar fermentation stimulation protein A [Rhodocyclaceae bacterium]